MSFNDVQFNMDIRIRKKKYQAARKGIWKQHARDCERFKQRIFNYQLPISYALEKKIKMFSIY